MTITDAVGRDDGFGVGDDVGDDVGDVVGVKLAVVVVVIFFPSLANAVVVEVVEVEVDVDVADFDVVEALSDVVISASVVVVEVVL